MPVQDAVKSSKCGDRPPHTRVSRRRRFIARIATIDATPMGLAQMSSRGFTHTSASLGWHITSLSLRQTGVDESIFV